MGSRRIVAFAALVLASTAGLWGQSAQPQQQPPTPSFRSGVNLILVDVTVRDRSGKPIRDLKASDFEVLENGKPQDIVSFAHEEVAQSAKPIVTASTLASVGGNKGDVKVTVAPPSKPAAPVTTEPAGNTPAEKLDASKGALTTAEVAGHRVWVLLFDTSSMQPEDVQKAVDSAIKWGQERMTTADLVAVASISSTLQVLTDFTNDKERIVSVLKALAVTDGTAVADVDASTMATDEALAAATTATTT